jgi:hypothetical protein
MEGKQPLDQEFGLLPENYGPVRVGLRIDVAIQLFARDNVGAKGQDRLSYP